MSSNINALKGIGKYLLLATQVKEVEPFIAYSCRAYALKCAVNIMKTEKSEDVKKYVLNLLNEVEEEKKSIDKLDIPDKFEYYKDFCLKVFNSAFSSDSQCEWTKDVAKAYFDTVLFIDVMVFYNEIPEKLLEIQKFSRWRSAEIMKAIKENRDPEPVQVDFGLGMDEDDDVFMEKDSLDIDIPDKPNFSDETELKNNEDNIPSEPSFDDKDIPSQPSFTNKEVANNNNNNTKPVNVQPKKPIEEDKPQKVEQTSNSTQIQQQSNGRKLIPSKTVPKQVTYTDQSDIMEATRYAKFAVSALMFDDTTTAIDNLKKALNILTKE